MSEIKTNKRWTTFWKSEMPLMSPRGRFLLSRYPKDLGRAVRDAVKGISSSMSAPGLKEFEEGYELKNLPIVYGIDEFYLEKGIGYVAGVISRFKDEGTGLAYIYANKRALRFKENYNSKK